MFWKANLFLLSIDLLFKTTETYFIQSVVLIPRYQLQRKNKVNTLFKTKSDNAFSFYISLLLKYTMNSLTFYLPTVLSDYWGIPMYTCFSNHQSILFNNSIRSYFSFSFSIWSWSNLSSISWNRCRRAKFSIFSILTSCCVLLFLNSVSSTSSSSNLTWMLAIN